MLEPTWIERNLVGEMTSAIYKAIASIKAARTALPLQGDQARGKLAVEQLDVEEVIGALKLGSHLQGGLICSVHCNRPGRARIRERGRQRCGGPLAAGR